MRKMPHKMGRHLLEERRKGCAEARARYVEERPLQERRRNSAFFAGHLELALAAARLDYLFGASAKTIRARLAEGLAGDIERFQVGLLAHHFAAQKVGVPGICQPLG